MIQKQPIAQIAQPTYYYKSSIKRAQPSPHKQPQLLSQRPSSSIQTDPTSSSSQTKRRKSTSTVITSLSSSFHFSKSLFSMNPSIKSNTNQCPKCLYWCTFQLSYGIVQSINPCLINRASLRLSLVALRALDSTGIDSGNAFTYFNVQAKS